MTRNASWAATSRGNSAWLRAAAVKLSYLGTQRRSSRVAGIVDAGGAEDNQIFVNLPVAQNLAGLQGKIELVQLSVSGTRRASRAMPRNWRERFRDMMCGRSAK